jgi:hypothetical protein
MSVSIDSRPTLVGITSEIDVVRASFYGVLGARTPSVTPSGIEVFVGCHTLTCVN